MDQTDSIMDSVDVDATAEGRIAEALGDELTEEQKARIRPIARRAYYDALAREEGPEEARAAAARAAEQALAFKVSLTDNASAPLATQLELLANNGFADAPAIYIDGISVAPQRMARDNVLLQRRDYDQKPNAVEAFAAIGAAVRAEERKDITAEQARVEMTDAGELHAGAERYTIEGVAFAHLCSRLGYGGAQYLAEKCPPRLRAANVNAQGALIGIREAKAALEAPKEKPFEASRIVLRTRKRAAPSPGRSIFACVSPGYGAFDADLVADALREATPPEAKGGVSYDGRRSRFEIWFQTTAEPRHMAAGETFRAGVVVSSSDDAGGSIRGQSVSWQSLCKNLCIISTRAEDAFSIRHVGNVYELARKFKGGFATALGQIERFIVAWNYATEDDLRRGARAASDGPLPDSAEDLMRGVFRGLVGGARPTIKLPGRRKLEELVEELVGCWRQDESSARAVHATSRASAVNAVTRYAHSYLDTLDPWAQDEVVRQASGLLWGRRGTPGEATASAPKPLVFVDAASAEASAS